MQVGDTTHVLPTAFMNHNGVMSTPQLPILTAAAIASPLAKPPRESMFQYPISEHVLEKWKHVVAVASYISPSLAKDMARPLLVSLSHPARAHLLEES